MYPPTRAIAARTGTIRRHGDGQLIASISIPPAIRPARASGDASAEVLIEGASATADLPALADEAASRVQAALAALDEIKDYAAEHAPGLLADNRLPVPASLRDALFLEGFTITGNGTEIAYDYGALDMIVVQADPGGQCYSVTLSLTEPDSAQRPHQPPATAENRHL